MHIIKNAKLMIISILFILGFGADKSMGADNGPMMSDGNSIGGFYSGTGLSYEVANLGQGAANHMFENNEGEKDSENRKNDDDDDDGRSTSANKKVSNNGNDTASKSRANDDDDDDGRNTSANKKVPKKDSDRTKRSDKASEPKRSWRQPSASPRKKDDDD